MVRNTECKRSIKILPLKGWGIEASTPQNRRGKFAMRSYTVSTAAAEYCEKPLRKPIVAGLLIAPKYVVFNWFKINTIIKECLVRTPTKGIFYFKNSAYQYRPWNWYSYCHQ
jgi:hypothetical protein